MKKFKIEAIIIDNDDQWPLDEKELAKIVKEGLEKEDSNLTVRSTQITECFDEILTKEPKEEALIGWSLKPK